MTTLFNSACDLLSLQTETVHTLRSLLTEDHRFYHNIDHVEFMIGLAQAEGKYSYKMASAIMFHDAVYYPQSTFNEELSIAFYREHIDLANSEVCNAIIATKNHLDDDNEHAPAWVRDFLDYDLYGFTDNNKFLADTVKIYREYSTVYDDDEIIEGRKSFLVKHLAKKRLYWNHPQWEDAARNNIYADLQCLEAESDYLEWLHSEVEKANHAEYEEYKASLPAGERELIEEEDKRIVAEIHATATQPACSYCDGTGVSGINLE